MKLLLFAIITVYSVSRVTAAPSLGNYSNTTIQLSGDKTNAPSAAPANTARITVSTSTNFKGKLEGNPTTGGVRITNANPAGSYTVTVTAFDSANATTSKSFTLTVTTPSTCNPLTFAAAADSTVGSFPLSVAVGDFNRDGKQDVAVVNQGAGTVSVLLGNGSGGFGAPKNFAVGNNPISVAVGDFNGDGKQDLAVANLSSADVSILLGDGAGDFGAATNFAVSFGPTAVAVGDFNADGKQDLAFSVGSNVMAILLGDGMGSFGAATTFGSNLNSDPEAVAVGDFNHDGKQDVVVANGAFGSPTHDVISVFLGDGAGSFSGPTTFAVGNNPRSVAVGDFNGDGKQDLAVANNGSGNVSILLGDGASGFSAATNFAAGSNPISITVGDFNGDGKQDVATANNGSASVSILLGDGNGSFAAPSNFAVGSFPFSVAVGDFNADGMQDLVTANLQSASISLLLRQCASPTPTPTPTPNPAPTPPPGKLENISTRMRVLAGDNVLIGGVIIQGSDPESVLFRALGPTLGAPPFNISGTLVDPTLELHGNDTSGGDITIASNDNWKDTQAVEIAATGKAPPNDAESAILATLNPGNYTVIVRGKNNGTGIGLVEAYDLSLAANSKLSNISSRGFVDTNDNVMIGGFIIGPTNAASTKVLVRGMGPTLAAPPFNVPGSLNDPTLDLHDGNGNVIATNDNWKTDDQTGQSQEAAIVATGLAPGHDAESAIVQLLAPGSYTAILRGKNNTTGVGLVEIYNIP